MSEAVTVEELKDKAVLYLKSHYGEDTVRMDIVDNGVSDGNGELHVDCTVSVGGAQSDWTKWFTYKDGEVTNMRWQRR